MHLTALLLIVAAAAPVPPSESPPPTAESPPAAAPAMPLVLVPTPRGVPAKKALDLHRRVVDALVKSIGERVVPVADVIKAQLAVGVTPSDLEALQGLKTLATATAAERAVVVTVGPKATGIDVYASFTGAPPLHIELPRSRRSPLNNAWAASVAKAVADRAEDTLAPRIEAPVMDLSEDLAPPPPPPPPPKVEAPPPPPPSSPWLMVGIGGGAAFRILDVSGPLAAKVSPMELGASPSVSGSISFAPLRLLDPTAWWNDALVDVWGRRGFIDARAGESVCTVDDDEVGAALSWRARLSDNPMVPRIGGGVAGSYERFAIGCDGIPALSTAAPQVAAFARIAQPLVPGIVELDASGGLRVPVVGEGSSFERPGFLGTLAITITPFEHIFVRAQARAFDAVLRHGDGGGDLIVSDARGVVELLVGGTL